MTARWVRVRDVLSALDIEHDEGIFDRDYLRKDELQAACDFIGIDSDGTMADLRQRLRDELFSDSRVYGIHKDITYLNEKDPDTAFSNRELRGITSAVLAKKRYDVTDIEFDPEYQVSPLNSVNVNGREFYVDYVESEQAHEDAAYESWVSWTLTPSDEDKRGGRFRLMFLRGLDTDACCYDHSVVLEMKRNYPPYETWKKQNYVTKLHAGE